MNCSTFGFTNCSCRTHFATKWFQWTYWCCAIQAIHQIHRWCRVNGRRLSWMWFFKNIFLVVFFIFVSTRFYGQTTTLRLFFCFKMGNRLQFYLTHCTWAFFCFVAVFQVFFSARVNLNRNRNKKKQCSILYVEISKRSRRNCKNDNNVMHANTIVYRSCRLDDALKYTRRIVDEFQLFTAALIKHHWFRSCAI